MAYKIVHAQDYTNQSIESYEVDRDTEFDAINGWKRNIRAGTKVCVGDKFQELIYSNIKYELFTPDFHLQYDDGYLEMCWYSLKSQPSISWMDNEHESLRQINVTGVTQQDCQSFFTSLFNVMSNDLFNPLGLDISKIKYDYFEYMGEKEPQLPKCFYIKVNEPVIYSYEQTDYSLPPGDYEARVRAWSPETGVVSKIQLFGFQSGEESFISQGLLEKYEEINKIVRKDESSDSDTVTDILYSIDEFYSNKSNYIEWEVGNWIAGLPENEKPDISDKYREEHNLKTSGDAVGIIFSLISTWRKSGKNVDISLKMNNDATKVSIQRPLYDMTDRELGLLKIYNFLDRIDFFGKDLFGEVKMFLAYNDGGFSFTHKGELSEYHAYSKQELREFLSLCSIDKMGMVQKLVKLANDISISDDVSNDIREYLRGQLDHML